MAFQYAHHRPITPITPVHSPHPSGGSSVRARTPGQLSLHEYRKMQVTPSPPAVPGQKTVKKKRGLSSLSRAESFTARSPNEYSYRSFDTLTTPPETPSVAPLMRFSTNVLPVGATTTSRVAHAPLGSTYPELAHLLGPGSQFENSPPYSPPVPSLSSTSRPLHSASPYQPPTPHLFADFESSPPPESEKHPLLGSLVDWERRPRTQYWGQDRKYVQLHSSITRPRSHQPAAAAAANEQHHLLERPRTTSSTRLDQGLPLDSGYYRLSRTPKLVLSEQPADNPHVASTPSDDVLGDLKYSQYHRDSKQTRERHFNSIKRLPRPDPSTKRRPAPLRLTTSNVDALYHSDNFATSTSTFSLSKYAFPNPPQTLAHLEDAKPKSAIDSRTSPHELKSPSVRFSGVSFEIVNPRHSIEGAGIVAASEDGTTNTLSPGETLSDNRNLLDEQEEEDSDMSDDDNRERPPRAQFYSSLQASYENVTRGGQSRSFTAPAAATTPPQAEAPPDWRFSEDGSRRSPEGETITGSVRAGPSTSIRDIDRVNSIGRAIEYPESTSSPSAVSQPGHGTEAGVSREVRGYGSSSGAGRARGGSATSGHSFSMPLPDSLRPSATLPDMVQSLRTSGQSGYANLQRASTGGSTDTPASNRPRERYHGYSSVFSTPGFGPTIASHAGDRPAHSSGISSFETNPFRSSRPESDAFEYDGPGYVRAPRDDSTVGNIIGQYARYSDASSQYDPPSPSDNPPERSSRDNPNRELPPVIYTSDCPPRCLLPPPPPGQTPPLPLPPDNSPPENPPPDNAPGAGNRSPRPSGSQLRSNLNPNLPGSHVGNGNYMGNGTHMGNGNQAGDARIPFYRRYGRRETDHLGYVPIDDLKTVEDFTEIAQDMGNNPVLRSYDEEWDERYIAFMRRAQELFGTQQRREWQRIVSAYHSDPALSEKLEEMAQAATQGIESPSQTHASVAGESSRPRRPRIVTSHTQVFQEAGEPTRRTLEPSSSGATVIRHADVPRIPPLPFRRLSSDYDDDDDSLNQHQPETNSSPLDSSPQLHSTSHQLYTSPGEQANREHRESETAQVQTAQEQRYRALQLREEQLNLETRLEQEVALARREADRGSHDIGPAPRGPAPAVPHSYDDPSLPIIRPLVLHHPPIDSTTEASYGTTGQLLFPHPVSPPLHGLGHVAVGQTDGSALDRRPPHRSRPFNENVIPNIWRSDNSPPGSGSYRGASRQEASLDRAREELGNDLNDADEWVTEPADSRPTSQVPEFFTFHTGGQSRHSGRGSYMGGRPLQRDSGGRATISNLPGFYPPHELSSEPPDEASDVISVAPPPLVHIGQNWAQQPDDIELGPVSPQTPRVTTIRAPRMVRPRYRSDDLDRNAFPRTPRARPASVRSTGSRTGRASVRYQTSLQPLRLSQSRASPTQPLLYRVRPDEMTDQQRLVADIVIVLSMTVLAPLCLPPFLLGVGVLNHFVGERATKKTKRFALAEAFVFFMIIIIAATVGITLSIREERRANGGDY